MADISALGVLNTEQTLDETTYAPASSGFQLPRKGRYTVQAPEITDAAFGKSNSGSLTAQIDPTIVGPTNEGFQLRFVKVSAKTFPRGKSGKFASQMGDYLTACGETTIPGDPAQLANAVQATSGRTYDILVDWRAFNKATGLTIEGMDSFPKDEHGNPIPYVLDPKDINPETGEPKRVWARLEVVKYLPSA